MKLFLSLLSIVIVTISCQKESTGGGGTPVAPAQTQMNVAYGTDAMHKMDIYLPAGRSSSTTKVLVLIHGGGWNQGDKADFATYVDTLKKRLPGYAIFNINYRLATGTTNFFPTQENDVKAAVDFIYSKRNEFLVSDKFVLLGASAGAHLALLQAYKQTSPLKVKAVIDFFGPTDLVEMYNNPINPLVPTLLAAVIGGTPTSNATLYTQSSPINFVTAQSPATMILQGGADVVVAPSQSQLLKTKLDAVGVINQYVFYPTENHGWTGANMIDSFDKIGLFLATHVN